MARARHVLAKAVSLLSTTSWAIKEAGARPADEATLRAGLGLQRGQN